VSAEVPDKAREVKLLPDERSAAAAARVEVHTRTEARARTEPQARTEPHARADVPARADAVARPAPAAVRVEGPTRTEAERVAAVSPTRQLSELPKDELAHLAEEFGLDPTRYKEPHELVAAIHERRQVIAAMDREAMLDVVRWGRRPVTYTATREQLAMEIARCRSMRFVGLSHRGLVVLARMRGVPAAEDEPVPTLIRRLKKQEGFFARLNRKRRSVIASVVSNLIGESPGNREYQFLPGPDAGGGGGPGPTAAAGRQTVAGPNPASIKEEIEDAGLIGGITNRLKKSADSYLNQKLDEIESRIDRKLDEIDRRLAEWRDKEVANRIKILKITLWASVVVGVVSLIYSYVVVNLYPATKAGLPAVQRPARSRWLRYRCSRPRRCGRRTRRGAAAAAAAVPPATRRRPTHWSSARHVRSRCRPRPPPPPRRAGCAGRWRGKQKATPNAGPGSPSPAGRGRG
jgi:hypothetical protein